MAETKAVAVVKNPEQPEPDQVIAEHIRQIADFMQKFNAGPLKRDLLVLLIHDHTKIARRDVNRILDSLTALRSLYLKPVTK